MMDSYANRANTIFYTFGQCLGFFAVLCHLTTNFYDISSVYAGVSHEKSLDLTSNTHYRADQANIEFNIDIDLSPEWNWNTNLFFVMIIAKYETPTMKINEVCIWDKIITSRQKSKLSMNNVINKYPLRDFDRHLTDREVTLEVRYRVMPITGIMFNRFMSDEGKDTFKLPKSYFRKHVKDADEEGEKKGKKRR